MNDFYIFLCYLTSIIYAISVDINMLHLFTNIFKGDDSGNNDEKVKEVPKKEMIPFHEKYLDEFNKLSYETLPYSDIECLKNNIVIENTPIGNVAMTYDHTREAFIYYTDNIMPYRFLETIARKFVIMFKCKSVFVDMNEEIGKAEKKVKDYKIEKEKRKEEEKNNEGVSVSDNKENNKKNVFAKFKTYNKNTSKDTSTTPNTSSQNNNKNEDPNEMVLKENANRYTCDGRFSNFMAIQKIDKKLTNTRLSMSFSEFKKMQSKKNSS
jgi:hypothetical protein